MSWKSGGSITLWNAPFNGENAGAITLTHNNANTIWFAYAGWWSGQYMTPGSRIAVWDWDKWFPATLNDVNIYETTHTPWNVNTHGMAWIDPCWSGVDPNTAKFAAYIKPGVAICQNNWWFQPYDPSPTRATGWEDKPYWKTYARVAGVHAQGAMFRVRVYTYFPPGYVDPDHVGDLLIPLTEPNVLTFIGEVSYASQWRRLSVAGIQVPAS